MKYFNKWTRNIRAFAKTVTILAIAAVIIGMSIMPVAADEWRERHWRREHHWHRGYHHWHRRHYWHRGYYERGYYYEPPPGIYAPPPPPPGVSIVFPIHIR